jgi:hypothetical protein
MEDARGSSFIEVDFSGSEFRGVDSEKHCDLNTCGRVHQ